MHLLTLYEIMRNWHTDYFYTSLRGEMNMNVHGFLMNVLFSWNGKGLYLI